MKKTIIAFSLLLLVGLALVGVGGFVLIDDAQQTLHGVCIGVGAGLSGLSIAKLIQPYCYYAIPNRHRSRWKRRISALISFPTRQRARGLTPCRLYTALLCSSACCLMQV